MISTHCDILSSLFTHTMMESLLYFTAFFKFLNSNSVFCFFHIIVRLSELKKLNLLSSEKITCSQKLMSLSTYFLTNSNRFIRFFWLIKRFFLATLPLKLSFRKILLQVSADTYLLKHFKINTNTFGSLIVDLFLFL